MPAPEEWVHSNRISFGDVRQRLDGAELAMRGELLAFVRRNAGKIRPRPDADWLYDQMSSYLLQCIARGMANDLWDEDASVHSPFEAARELVHWFKWYTRASDLPSTRIRLAVDRIEAAYRDGDRGGRNCIETGFLEHALETPSNRQHFAHWASDPLLAESYTEALRWGCAHGESEGP